MRQLPELLFWWAAATGVWLLTLSSMSLSEVAVASASGLPCAVAAIAARRAVDGSWPARPAWLRWLVPLPLAVVADTARVLGRAAAVLVGRPVPSGRLRTVRLDRDRPDARWRSRQAVSTVLVSAAPGTVVVDVEVDTGLMRLHALGSGAPAMEDVVSR